MSDEQFDLVECTIHIKIHIMKLLSFLLLAISFSSFAADYYVSPGGNDANPGSELSPWATLQYSTDQLLPGDILHVMDGTFNEKISINVSGSAGMPITITGFGYTPIINGSGIASQTAVIDITDKNYVTIEFLAVEGNEMNDASGIQITGACSNVILRSNHISDINFSATDTDPVISGTNAFPLKIHGTHPSMPITNLLLEGNEILDCRTGYSGALNISGNVDSFQVLKNNIHELTNSGIVISGHQGVCPTPFLDQARNGRIEENTLFNCFASYTTAGAISVDGAKRLEILRNLTYHNSYGIQIACSSPGESADSITVRNNLIHSNLSSALVIGETDFPANSGLVNRCTVYNNTLYQNDTSSTENGEICLRFGTNLMLQNNIIYTGEEGIGLNISNSPQGLVSDYNLFYAPANEQSTIVVEDGVANDLSTFQTQSGQELNSFFMDPQFYDPEGTQTPGNLDDDFIFDNQNSPAVDQGNPAYVPLDDEEDYYGNDRVFGSQVDMGAAEMHLLSLPETGNNSMKIYPNPASDKLFLSNSGEDYSIFDMSGKQVQSGRLDSGFIRLDHLPAGSYFIETLKEHMIFRAKFVKL